MEPDKLRTIPVDEQFRIMADKAPALIWISGLDKSIYFFNAEWLRFTGRALDEEIGNGWIKGVHPDDLERCARIYNTSFDARREFKMEYRLKRHDGVYRWFTDRGVPRYTPDGTFAGYIGSCMDINELLENERVQKDFIHSEALRNQQLLNEELATTNEELLSSNEELQATQTNLDNLNNALEDKIAQRTLALGIREEETQRLNRELSQAVEELRKSNNDLSLSREHLQDTINALDLNTHKIRAIVEAAPFPIGVYVGREMKIELANQAILDVWGKGNDVVGKLYAEVLPELETTGIYEQLDGVYLTGKPFIAQHQRVDLVVDGVLRIFYFNYTFTPLYNPSGSIYGVMNTAADVTDLVIAKHRVEQSEKNLKNMILQSPVAMCIMLGPDHRVEVANEMMLELWGKPSETVLGKPIFEGLPDAQGQGLEKMLHDVYRTGISLKVTEQAVSLLRNGKQETVYQNFVFEPYRDTDGIVKGVIAITLDVTDQVVSRQIIEENYREQQALNEELTATNEEVSHVNEELAATNEELTETQNYLERTIGELAESEARFKFLIQKAPVAIGVLHGRELIIDSANEMILTLWGKGENIIGKPLSVGLPELKGQPFLGILDNVYTTGKAHYGYETPVLLEHDGQLTEIYCDFVYQPLADESGVTKDIMVVAIDVTVQVTARRKVERAEESLRMAIEAAELGSYYIDTSNRTFVASPRLKEFFGFSAGEDVTYEAAINQIHPDYRKAVADLVEKAITKGIRFDMEYPVIGHNDGKLRWVRGIGTVQDYNNGKDRFFTGVLHEITEKKLDEIRKNDFIGMVSHELKTPLTSLTAIIQVSKMKLSNSEDKFLAGAMDKANIQVKRMTTMINGFLNIARFDSGKIVINKQEIVVNDLLREIIEEAEIMVSTHNIKFGECEPIRVMADRDKIGSVVSNFLNNAVKYSEEHTTIEIACRTMGRHVVVSVSDQGIGIKGNDLEKIFDRYYRVDSNNTQHISGFGIGLYLSAEIVRGHGGKIWADSTPGEGSTFYFSLPL